MFVVCKDHVELAIDMFMDEYEEAPDIVDLEKVHFTKWTAPELCSECEEKARFLII